MKSHLDRPPTRSRGALHPGKLRIVPEVPRAVYVAPLIAVLAALMLILTLVGPWSSHHHEPSSPPSSVTPTQEAPQRGE